MRKYTEKHLHEMSDDALLMAWTPTIFIPRRSAPALAARLEADNAAIARELEARGYHRMEATA